MAVTEERARELLDELAEELVARGYPEDLAFAVQGRRARRMRSSALYFIGFDDGLFSCWYRESAERSVLRRSDEFAEVRDVFVRAVEAEAENRMSQFEEEK